MSAIERRLTGLTPGGPSHALAGQALLGLAACLPLRVTSAPSPQGEGLPAARIAPDR